MDEIHFSSPALSERIQLLVLDSATSTNLLVKDLGAKGAPEGTLITALEQTQGRGRLGRRFESPAGSGLYFTILLRPDLPAAESLQITILAAVAAAEGIAEVTGLAPEIKWVNDLYLNDRKICGILAESALKPDTGHIDYTALGIGVNLTEPEGGFGGTASGVAGALYPYGTLQKDQTEELRTALLAATANRILRYYDELKKGGAVSYMARYRASNYLFGKDVLLVDDITRPELARRARAEAIDEEGRLIVTLPDGTKETVVSGDVTVKLN